MLHASPTKAKGLLRRLRSKSWIRPHDDIDGDYEPLRSPSATHVPPVPALPVREPSPPVSAPARRSNYTARLPHELLRKICSFVCPHSADRSHVSSENSAVGDGCMLCDMRDLARVAQVDHKWYKAAQSLLYTSVRIDAVHYCELEALLSKKRQRKSVRHPVNDGKEDVPARRLSLFCRTVRESPDLGQQVEMLKLPYMTRETSKGELAATVAVLPNLRYVDLPEGVFDGDASCHTLVNELRTRCPRICRMVYRKGAESYLESLTSNHWLGLEDLELSGVSIEPGLLRVILGSLPALDNLMMLDLAWLNDSLFDNSPELVPFPAVSTLAIEDCPGVTSEAFKRYLSQERNRMKLRKLRLRRTGVTVPALADFLYDATQLQHLTIVAKVTFSDTLAINASPLLTSISLSTLDFEITDAGEHTANITRPSAAFYSYLARSLHSNSLPALRTLYARDPTFPDLLSLPIPGRPTLASPLKLFTKALDESEWIYTLISPEPTDTSRLSVTGGRPLSAYAASRGLGPQWGPGAESVVVGNGFGGFLAVPRDDAAARPRSAGGGGPARDGGLWPPTNAARPKSMGPAALQGGAWEQKPLGRFSGLMAKVGVPIRGRVKVQKYDLWR